MKLQIMDCGAVAPFSGDTDALDLSLELRDFRQPSPAIGPATVAKQRGASGGGKESDIGGPTYRPTR
jgi:hypothetical protein